MIHPLKQYAAYVSHPSPLYLLARSIPWHFGGFWSIHHIFLDLILGTTHHVRDYLQGVTRKIVIADALPIAVA